MSTSLQEQLQRLALPQSSQPKSDRKRASLLFDPKEAAELSKETVYQIGLEGYQELASKNSAFIKFENTLFHFTSKEVQRATQNAEANEQLDKHIRRFFVQLSPYFLLSSSHKALEWLIYRYNIHEYNKEDLLMLILPYHETNIFVRALQLIKIKDNDKWLWLKPLQKPGLHLPKTTLFNHAASDPFFIQIISNYVLFSIKEHDKPSFLNIIYGFYCTTFTGALEHCKEVPETILTQMLPCLVKGLKSDLPDFCAASYIIVSKLLTKMELSSKLLNKIVERITSVNVQSLRSEAMLVLVVLYQCQEQYKVMESSAIKNLAKEAWVPKVLSQLCESGCLIKPLLAPLIHAAMCEAFQEDASDVCQIFFNQLLAELKLDEFIVQNIMSAITKSYNPETKYLDETKSWLKTLLNSIEKQNSIIFDKEMSAIIKCGKAENELFQQILVNDNIKYRVELFEKLYHPSPEIRKAAIKFLIKNFDGYRVRERDFIQNAIIDRLKDDDFEVVEETLKISSAILVDIIEKDMLKSVLTDLLVKSRKAEVWNVSTLGVEILCDVYSGDDFQVFLSLLPFLLPVCDKSYVTSQTIIKSPYVKKCTFLKLIDKKLKSAKNYSDVFNAVFENFNNQEYKPDVQSLITCINKIPSEEIALKYVAMLLLCNSLPSNCSFDVTSQIMNILLSYFKTNNLKLAKIDSNENYITMTHQNKVPIQGFLSCVEALITNTTKDNIANIDFYVTDSRNKFLLQSLSLLLKGSCNVKGKIAILYSKTLKIFLGHFCENLQSKIEFLLNVVATDNVLATAGLKLRCLRTFTAILSPEIPKIYFDFKSILIPYLLMALQNEQSEIRASGLQCVHKILELFNDVDYDYKILLQGIWMQKDDIRMDSEQLPLVLHNVLSGKKCTVIVSELVKNIDSDLPVYLKSGIIKAFSHFKDIIIYRKFVNLACTILIDKPLEIHSQNSNIIQELIKQLDVDIVKKIELKDNVCEFLNLVLRNDKLNFNDNFISISLLNKLNNEIFANLKPAVRDSLLDIIIEMTTISSNTEFHPAAAKIFKHIELDACSILPQLIEMREVKSPKMDTAKLKRRISIVPTVDILDTLLWKKGVTVLEFIQDKKKISTAEILLPVLFDLLKKSLDFEEQASVEYPKQLILSSILHCCDKAEVKVALPKTVFNMELVVQCIRASPNPQTHHHALLLLACVAPIIPDEVLHHIMAIFTFIGSSILRHDDAYSFQIITKIIDSIIPIISKDNSESNRLKILHVFVSAIIDVPVHRRIPLYTQLLNQLGINENLPLFTLLMLQAHVFHEKSKSRSNTSHLDIASNFCLEFSPETVIYNCKQLFDYLKKLPENKEEIKENLVIDFNIYTAKQFRHFKYTLITFTSNLLSSTEFVKCIAELDEDKTLELETLFKELIIKILTYIQATSKIADRNVNTPQAQYWKVMLHHAYDILDSLNALLTPQMFLLVVKGLMTHNLSTVKRRVLDLLISKLQSNPEFFADCEEDELYAMLPPIIAIIKEVQNENLDSDQLVVIQTALLTLKLFVRILAPSEPKKFTQILQFVSELILLNIDTNILASAVLCLAELCMQLRGHAIPCLNKFMPTIIKVIKVQKHEETPTLLLLSAITALIKIFDCLAQFLSPYIEKLLRELTNLLSIWNIQSENPKIVPFLNKLIIIKQKIGISLPARIFIPAIENTYNHLIAKSKYDCVGPLMEIFSECLSNLQGAEIQNNMPELSSLFLNILQFRADGNGSYEECNEVESHVIKALTSWVLKLSETTFRPFYYKLYDWAIRGEVKSERIITFYSLSSVIAEALKSIFVLFADYILNNIAVTLIACNKLKNDKLYFEDDNKNMLLLEHVLKTINCVCIYDKNNLIDKERFNLLMDPIVDQLDNPLGGDKFESRSKKLVIPCIVNFTAAVGNDGLWKTLNYQILLKMRDTNKTVRLIALECLRSVADKIGENFLPLLPETIPFLAELLEDEEEDVEKACRHTVQELERVVGDSLQKYF